MNLFIDTNIYLAFFHFTNDDLEELRKLLTSIETGKIVLYLPQQVVDEFQRNREKRIADALDNLKKSELNKRFPQFSQQYPEYSQMRRLLREYESVRNTLLEKVMADIKSKSLGADLIIDQLFKQAKIIPLTNVILDFSKQRFDLGNPPGKNDSYGDMINWATLINEVPKGQDLHIITDDQDFVSTLNENQLSDYLVEEWKKFKQSEVYYYRTLSGFFRLHFPEIKLAVELERSAAISAIATSGSFASTHVIIGKLSHYPSFSDSEVQAIVDGIIFNGQVHSIGSDSDVKDFIQRIINDYGSQIDPTKTGLLEKYMKDWDSDEGNEDTMNIDTMDNVVAV